MNDFMYSLFSPLSEDYCMYFYYLAIFSFIILIGFVLILINYFIKEGTKSDPSVIMLLAYPFIAYFQNRLLYSMCVN